VTGLVIALALLALAPLVLPYALDLGYPDAALPGVSIQGQPVAGLPRETINAELAERYRPFLSQPIALTYAGETWTPSLAELGARFDTEAVARAAVTAGRQGDPLTRLRELWQLWRHGLDVTPRLVVDQRALQSYLLGLALLLERPPENAALSIATARVVGTPGAAGVQVLVDATANDVLLALRDLQPREVPVRTRRLDPSIGDEALVAAQRQAVALLQSPIEMRHNERVWVWSPERLAELLRVEPVANRLALRVDDERLAPYPDPDPARGRVATPHHRRQPRQPGHHRAGGRRKE
jgi:hypothetical protein